MKLVRLLRPHSPSVPNRLDFTLNFWKKELKEYLDEAKAQHKKLRYPARFEFKMKDKSEYQTKPRIVGIDTETYVKNGNILCLSTSEAPNDHLIGYTYQRISIGKIFDFLERYNNKGTIFVAWNMKFDATAILKGLADDTELKKFKIEDPEMLGEDQEYYLETTDYSVRYLPKKMLQFKRLGDKHKKAIEIFDGLQFFKGEEGGASLENIAKAYKEQLEKKGIKAYKDYDGKYSEFKNFPEDIVDNDPEEFKKVLAYCHQDCKLAKALVEIWLETYYKNFGFYPPKLYSTGYITQLYWQVELPEMFSFNDIPIEIQDAAYKCFYGGRFEVLARGLLHDIWHYDINSAYPYAMVIMPDFKRGKWIRIQDLKKFKEYENNVGFYKINADVDEPKVAPFMFRDHNGSVFAPNGLLSTYTTADELRVALRYYNCRIEKIDGYAFIPLSKDQNAFSKMVQEMYDTRQTFSKKDPVQKVQNFVYKVLINSGYGKFAQHKPEPRGFFNPVICSYITGKCRSMLLEAAAQDKENVVMFATDAIFTKKPLKLKEGNMLGDWEAEFHKGINILMAGIYQYTQEGKDDFTKTRGFGTRVYKEARQETKTQFSIRGFDTVYDEESQDIIFNLHIMRPVSISEAVIQHKYSIDDLCKMEFHPKKVKINGDTKRIWFNDLKHIDDYSDSVPRRV